MQKRKTLLMFNFFTLIIFWYFEDVKNTDLPFPMAVFQNLGNSQHIYFTNNTAQLFIIAKKCQINFSPWLGRFS